MSAEFVSGSIPNPIYRLCFHIISAARQQTEAARDSRISRMQQEAARCGRKQQAAAVSSRKQQEAAVGSMRQQGVAGSNGQQAARAAGGSRR